LGLAIARRLVAKENAKLAILARDQQELLNAKSDLVKYGSTVTTWTCDVKNESSVVSTIEEIAAGLGGIDVLINNAGEIVVGPLDAMDRKDFQVCIGYSSLGALQRYVCLFALLVSEPVRAGHQYRIFWWESRRPTPSPLLRK
jgi:NAD(P)-dependent dehydrogenase (short-subunit alcohol dehydrogenase family)